MKCILLVLIMMNILTFVNGQNNQYAIYSNADSIIKAVPNSPKGKNIKLNEHLSIEVDSGLYKFGICPECYSVLIQDTSNFPTTIILFDKDGNIIDFYQNFKNRLGFKYDKKTGKLKNIMYKSNNGKYKSIRIK